MGSGFPTGRTRTTREGVTRAGLGPRMAQSGGEVSHAYVSRERRVSVWPIRPASACGHTLKQEKNTV